MNSKEPKQTPSFRELLEDPAIQRRTRAWAERLVLRYKLAPMSGEDLYQSAITRLLRYSKFEEPCEIENPLGYLFKILHNQAITAFHTVHAGETVEFEEVPNQKLSDNLDMVQRIESGILLTEVFRSLDEDERVLFTCILYEYSTRQIAVIFNISHVTVAHRVKLLIKKIQKSLI